MTAVEWLVIQINSKIDVIPLFMWDNIRDIVQQAKEMEKQHHGQTWDAAIAAHDNRGHVHSRSIIDFDEWYEQQFKTK
jgi:hypothetical protein